MSGFFFIHSRLTVLQAVLPRFAFINQRAGSSKFYSRFDVHRVHWLPKHLEVGRWTWQQLSSFGGLPYTDNHVLFFIVVSESASRLSSEWISGSIHRSSGPIYSLAAQRSPPPMTRSMNQFTTTIDWNNLETPGIHLKSEMYPSLFPILLHKKLYFFAFKFGKFK